MDAIVAERSGADSRSAVPPAITFPEPARLAGEHFPDPLEDDLPTDEVLLTTRRAIGHVALVATKAATHFQRDAVEHDAMAWMFAPRAVFDGAAAVDACLHRDACLRGILLHGLGLGLDVERSAVNALLVADDGDFEEHEFRYLYADGIGHRANAGRRRSARPSRLHLVTAIIVDTRENRMRQVFHASMARNHTEVRSRLAGRFGPDVAELADVRVGVHVASPPVVALVPEPVIELIRRMARESAKPHARFFAVDIELGIQV